jgi:hypothetical protein
MKHKIHAGLTVLNFAEPILSDVDGYFEKNVLLLGIVMLN